MFDMQANARASAAKPDYPLGGTLLGARNLMKDRVVDASGKYLGEIEDIVLNTRSGCVRYAVVALGGFLGMGCKRVAVPWSALTPDANNRRCVLNLAQMQLMAVPLSDDDQRPRANPLRGGNVCAQ
jgi:sporulation protein YlmC with PRC-barrel domain